MQRLDDRDLVAITGGQDSGPQPRLDIPWPNVGRGRQSEPTPMPSPTQPSQPQPSKPSWPKLPWLPMPLGPLF